MIPRLFRLFLIAAGLACFSSCETTPRKGYEYESIPWSGRVGDDVARSRVEDGNGWGMRDIQP